MALDDHNADERVPVKLFRILCSDSAWNIEDELHAYTCEPEPQPVTKPLF